MRVDSAENSRVFLQICNSRRLIRYGGSSKDRDSNINYDFQNSKLCVKLVHRSVFDGQSTYRQSLTVSGQFPLNSQFQGCFNQTTFSFFAVLTSQQVFYSSPFTSSFFRIHSLTKHTLRDCRNIGMASGEATRTVTDHNGKHGRCVMLSMVQHEPSPPSSSHRDQDADSLPPVATKAG